MVERSNPLTTLSIDPDMTAASPVRPARVVVLAITATLLALPACKPAATVQNNTTAAPIADGSDDDANFVVPEDEGSVDEGASAPTNAADHSAAAGSAAANHAARAHGGTHR